MLRHARGCVPQTAGERADRRRDHLSRPLAAPPTPCDSPRLLTAPSDRSRCASCSTQPGDSDREGRGQLQPPLAAHLRHTTCLARRHVSGSGRQRAIVGRSQAPAGTARRRRPGGPACRLPPLLARQPGATLHCPCPPAHAAAGVTSGTSAPPRRVRTAVARLSLSMPACR